MIRKFRKDQRGQSLTEFALIVPLLLLLVSGIIDFGRFCYGYLELQMAAQETVRLGGLGRSDSEMESFARDYLNISDPAKLTITISPPDSQRDSGDYVTVTLQTPYQFVTPLANDLLTSVSGISAYSTIRVE
ncbi:TadE/TadG family type IV pilus assembly protein [Paenibacillus alkalitolerans]|uniref:TadE/TadG family type IV pilus assembly protein n=1 Tax=Paenibacillus alkalitolerans TaxID=2799335 RepID=UPI0018F64F82|nr:TadE/TadG family type IV pilus assembly protein [Paenibacillus alkalitolerans]